jgi:hypothetical protein
MGATNATSSEHWKKLSKKLWIHLAITVLFFIPILIIVSVLISRSTRDEMQASPILRVCVSMNDSKAVLTPTISNNSQIVSTRFSFNKVVYDKHNRYSSTGNSYSIFSDGPFRIELHMSLKLEGSSKETIFSIWKVSDGVSNTLSTWHKTNQAKDAKVDTYDFTFVSHFEENDYLFVTIQSELGVSEFTGLFDCSSNYLQIYDLRL